MLDVVPKTEIGPLEMFDTILDWIFNWRLNLCFWTGVALAILALSRLDDPLSWILAIVAVITGLIVGFRWDRE